MTNQPTTSSLAPQRPRAPLPSGDITAGTAASVRWHGMLHRGMHRSVHQPGGSGVRVTRREAESIGEMTLFLLKPWIINNDNP